MALAEQFAEAIMFSVEAQGLDPHDRAPLVEVHEALAERRCSDDNGAMRTTEDLASEVRSPDSRTLFQEAVKAYEAGAHRAAIVTTWTVVVFDLYSKLRELGEHEKRAAEFVGVLDKAIADDDRSELSKLEAEILDICWQGTEKKRDRPPKDGFYLFSAQDHKFLSRLRQDRHLCAHPAMLESGGMFAPTAEAALAHLAGAVDACLAHAPLEGRALEERFKEFKAGSAWIDDDGARRSHLKRAFLDVARESSRKRLVRDVVKGSYAAESDERLARRNRQLSGDFAHVAPDLFEQVLLAEIAKRAGDTDPDQLQRLVGAFGDREGFWDAWPSEVLPWMAEVLEKAPADSLIDSGAMGVPLPLLAGGASDVADVLTKRRVGLSPDRRAKVAVSTPNRETLDELVAAFESSASFDDSNTLARAIHSVASSLTPEQIDRVREAAVGNSQVSDAFDVDQTLLAVFRNDTGRAGARDRWADAANARRKVRVGESKGGFAYPTLRAAYAKL